MNGPSTPCRFALTRWWTQEKVVPMLKRLEPKLRLMLGMAILISLLGVTAGLWWWLPAHPRAVLFRSGANITGFHISADWRTLLAVQV